MAFIIKQRMWNASSLAKLSGLQEPLRVLANQSSFGPGIDLVTVAPEAFGSLIEAVEEGFGVTMPGLTGKLSWGHVEIGADQGIDEEVFVALDGRIDLRQGKCSLSVFRNVCDAVDPFARATRMSSFQKSFIG